MNLLAFKEMTLCAHTVDTIDFPCYVLGINKVDINRLAINTVRRKAPDVP